MKNTKKIKFAAVFAAIAVAASITVYAAYDSSKDPLVSLSYLTDVFKPDVKKSLKSEISSELRTELNAELKKSLDSYKTQLDLYKTELDSYKTQLKKDLHAQLSDEIHKEVYDEVTADYAATIDALQKQIDVLSNEYSVVSMTKNQRLTVSAACEIVILSGTATVRCSAKGEGIIDCTDGIILYDGQNIPANHKLLVPENGDGRGLTATGTVQLLVKGGYTLG